MQSLDNRQSQRWLAVGLLFIMIILIIVVFIRPLIMMGFKYHDEKSELILSLQRYQRIIEKKESIIKGLENLRTQHEEQGYLDTHETVALASIDLQNSIKAIVIEAGGTVGNVNRIDKKTEGNFTRIGVKIRMTVTADILRAVFYKIETSTPLMIINQVNIKPVRGKKNRTTKKMEPSNQLNVNFQVVSFMRAEQE